jgi:uncharacterized membrane protein YcaP (DUF421 family)
MFVRTAVVYLAVLFLMRIMGKREVGQLSLFDLVVAIMIAELAAIPLSDNEMSLLHGIVPISTLVLLEIILSYMTLKSLTARKIIEGTPSIIVEKGRLLEEEMRRLRYNIDDMISQMREQGVYNLEDVEYAILETDGKLSLILKSEKRPVISEDLGLQPAYEGLPLPLISDGKLLKENMALAEKSREWLEENLRTRHNCSIGDVLYATLDTKGKLVVYLKGERKKTP